MIYTTTALIRPVHGPFSLLKKASYM